LATLRCTNTSPGSRPVISLAGTRLSAQPIHMYCGLCCCSQAREEAGLARSVVGGPARLLKSSSVLLLMASAVAARASHRLGEQLAADQHAADLADVPAPIS
jgi:hypothetical protein